MPVQDPSIVRYTFQDLLDLPESHARHEIIDGRLVVTPTPRVNHQRVAANLVRLLGDHARRHELGDVYGPMTVRLHDELVLEPDIVFISNERMGIADPEGWVHGPPDLVIEVLSPSTWRRDGGVKRKRYLESGVAELWIVDVDARSIDVWRAGAVQPERVEDTLRWQVAGEPIDISLLEVFRGVRPRR
jgi:Uma2 family endonuclease